MKKKLLVTVAIALISLCNLYAQDDLTMHPSLTRIGEYDYSSVINQVNSPLKAEAFQVLNPNVGSPSEVLVVVNQNSELSMSIGEYYMQLRGIPDINLCILDCSSNEEIQRPEYIGKILSPIKNYLEDNALKSRIRYIATTKGVPLKIYADGIYTLNTHAASVDSELALIDYGSYGFRSWFYNPYFGLAENLNRNRIPLYLVNRLTSYGLDLDTDGVPMIIKSYLEKALFPPEREGTFVLDVTPKLYQGGYGAGNDWMTDAAGSLEAMGANVLLDETTNFLVEENDVIGYCSWGSNDPDHKNHGQPYFEWLDGSIATTYVSTNARTFAYPPAYGQSMIADLIEEGLTGVYGNVYEPFLTACARPDILFPRYYRGFNLAESYYMSLNYLSWMEIVVGDPLCAPYAKREPRVYITTNRVIYTTGDVLNVDVDIWNTGEEEEVGLYVAIAIGGKLYFYPNWQPVPNFEIITLNSRSRLHLDILDLDLSGNIGQGNFTFYSAITDRNGMLIGDVSVANIELQ